MKKRNIIIASICAAALVISGITVGIIVGVNSKKKQNLYDLGVKYLVDARYQEATKIFADPFLKNYKDTSKKYNYSFNLQRYEQYHYSYENLIDFGLKEEGSIASVDFRTQGGKEIPRKTIKKKQEGTYITEVAEKAHYDFVSWSLNYAGYEKSTDSIRYILESNYSDRRYEINYDLNGGTTSASLPRFYYYNNGSVSIPNLVKKGNTFLGYDSNLYSSTTENFEIPNGTAQDVELTAIFNPNTYSISFNAGYGVVDPSPVDVVYGSDVSTTFPTVSKVNYTFDYWTYNGKQVDLTKWSIANNVTLLAHYTPIEYSISYRLHGAIDPGLPTNCNFESRIDLPFVEKADSLFTGWTKYESGVAEKPDFTISNANGDLDIEAKFVNATIDETGKLIDIDDKEDLKDLVIPSFVTDIKSDLVSSCPNLLKIWVDARNENFTTDENNNLLIKDKTIAFALPIKGSQYLPYDTLNIPVEIKEIGENAFRGTKMLNVNGSGLITKINDYAFYGCDSLVNCNLENISYVGNYAFENSSITEAFISNNESTLTHIGDYAFKGSDVSEISISNAVKHIGDGAFSNLTGFNTIDFYPNTTCEIGENIFEGCTSVKTLNTDSKFLDSLIGDSSLKLQTINLKGSVNISDSVCENYESLKTLDLHESSINQIGADAFKGATLLESAQLPNSMRRIKEGAFEDCSKLSSFNFNNLSNLFQIEGSAFKGTAFTSLDFTNNPHLTIQDHAFTSCTKLTEIKMIHGQIVTRMVDVFNLCTKIDSVTYYIEETDGDVIIPNFLFENLNNVTRIRFEYLGNVQKEISLGNYAFKNCASLIDISMINCRLRSVPYHCFEGCLSLTNANGRLSNLDSYGDGAFLGCVNLDHMSFGPNLTYIGSEAFAGCYSLLSINPLVISNSDLIMGLGAFADIYGELQFWFSKTVVDTYKETPGKWYHFDEGFSGTLTYLVT